MFATGGCLILLLLQYSQVTSLRGLSSPSLLPETPSTTDPLITPTNNNVVTIQFPSAQQTDAVSANPCFKFSGNIHFTVSYSTKPKGSDIEREKLVEFDLPPVSDDMVSGSCSSPDMTYVSTTFRANDDFNCRMDANFTLVNVTADQSTNATTPFTNNSSTYTTVSRLQNIQLDCDVKDAIQSVKATLETPIDLSFPNASFQCDSTFTLNLSPSIMMAFKNLRVQAFNLSHSGTFNPATHCSSDPPTTTPTKTVDPTTPASVPTTSPNTIRDGPLPDVTSSQHVPETTKSSTRLPIPNWPLGSDLKILFNPDKKDGGPLTVEDSYIAQHGDPALNGKEITVTTTESTDAPVTTATTDATTSSTTLTTTKPLTTTLTTPALTTLIPTTSPVPSSPATLPPNVVPPVGHWTLNRTRALLPTNQTCLILEMSLVMDITYVATSPKPNSTIVDYVNKTVKIALPSNPTTVASGSCVDWTVNQVGKRQILTLTFPIQAKPWSLVFEFLDAPHNATDSLLNALKRSVRDLSPIINKFHRHKASNSSNNTVDPDHYALDTVRLHYDTHSFPDAVYPDLINLSLSAMKMFHTKDGKASFCNSEQKIVLSPKVSLHTYNFKARPFITNPNQTNFGEAQQCEADRLTSDIVPIAVGCALAALIIVVLVAYAIGRHRRRRQGYQTVE